MQLGKTVHYLPILFIDQLSNRVKDLMVSRAFFSSCSCYSWYTRERGKTWTLGSEL